MTTETPRELGYRWPAEWEHHRATWLTWPRNPETWPGWLEEVEQTFVAMTLALAGSEEVRILVPDEALQERVRGRLSERGWNGWNVSFFRVPTNDAWVRDSGPIFVKHPDGDVAITDWDYNAWGGKYPPWDDDDRIPERLAEILCRRHFPGGMVLEGGSVDGNGAGTLLTTEQCLLNPNRNPRFRREDIEERLKAYLGVRKILWLGEGIEGDDTDGHVDDIARFVGPSTVLAVREDDRHDPNHEPLRKNLDRLRCFTTADGDPLRVETLPMPAPVSNEEGRLPASYANFYVANRAVLVPVFGDPRDDEACDVLAGSFPDRRIVPIRANALVTGFGAVHCLTQQEPR